MGVESPQGMPCHHAPFGAAAPRHAGVVVPYALRGTEAQHAVPREWPPPTKFRAEIWGVGQVVVSYGTAGDAPQCRGHSSAVRWG